ncbi:DUF1015 domain-containing protein [Faecalibacter rhinopitheci]|uniref:DUF1015 domain-containing protein n=1 Tax=Faecalibacter rhinopitheci TaxID=2779678 RepID=A0A8J7G9L6_9FLAO|nr:DUF1015 domain-containing protein [Faecalibacter rhinopitheci]MBF0598025.1 DUF1015 domain-containing protein [Faecalibacter rhinopitheci]MBQ0146891.1 DUF1015 domain-containing protein [Candidatus Onthonaster equi]
MPQFRPFKGIRPTEETVQDFVTKSIDRYSVEELQENIKTRNHSFLHVIEPTWDQSIEDISVRFSKVRNNLEDYIDQKVLVQDKSSFYIYQVVQPNGRKTKGLLGLVNINDYNANTIKKHEETIDRRVELFANYLKGAQFHAEPVLLTHKPAQRVDLLLEAEMKRKPTLTLVDTDNVEHSLWRIDNRLNLKQFKDSIEKLEEIYIADGHHRMESSSQYTAQAAADSGEKVYGDETFNYTLAMLVSHDELIINDYNRVVKDLNGLSKEDFIQKIEEYFEVIPKGNEQFLPTKKHHILMYIDNEFYSLYTKSLDNEVKGLKELDTYIFEQHLLKPILNIHDTRNDKRIGFVHGTKDLKGIETLKAKVDTGEYVAGFAFYPVSVADLQLISDLGLKMPPKSTYIEPKPLSGFAVFDLKD